MMQYVFPGDVIPKAASALNGTDEPHQTFHPYPSGKEDVAAEIQSFLNLKDTQKINYYICEHQDRILVSLASLFWGQRAR